ncbi:MAG TPA: cytochrome b N-terminal domain-containing protein [Bryobacteraceae bacterium]|nr:cytochrome b N-terminal domain-containing protein [Bryobacteraceae bacterium]
MAETNGHDGKPQTPATPAAGGNGSGNGGGGVAKVLAGAKAVQTRAIEELKETVKAPEKTDLWKSVLRVKHDETPRSRALGVLSNVFLHLHPAKVNRDAVAYNYTWGMGGMTFYVYITLVFTGTLLMFYYHPSKVVAFRDILYLENDVPFGKLLRNMHRWGAHLMVIMVELHMFRVFLTGSYKKPREFNWVVGVLLLVLTLLLSFTGYLLPDDQLGFWAVTVGTNMARATPLLGNQGPFGPQLGMTPFNDVRFGLLGGSIVDSNALLRAYIWHCVAIPIIASAFMVVHFWRVRKDGGISGPAPVVLEKEIKDVRKI